VAGGSVLSFLGIRLSHFVAREILVGRQRVRQVPDQRAIRGKAQETKLIDPFIPNALSLRHGVTMFYRQDPESGRAWYEELVVS